MLSLVNPYVTSAGKKIAQFILLLIKVELNPCLLDVVYKIILKQLKKPLVVQRNMLIIKVPF